MAKKGPPALDKARVLEALAKTPGGAKRDLARVLGVKGDERITLKRILKELEDEGAIDRGKKRSYSTAGALPDVLVLEISGQDNDGELLARPQKWEGEEEPPKIYVVPGKDQENVAQLGRGERVLARLSQTRDGYEARIIKHLGASVHRVLGVYHTGPHQGRIEPIDRKSRIEFIVDNRDRGGAQSNELVIVEPLSGRGFGGPRARVIERLGSMSEPKAVSLIAIHAHGIPTEFPKAVLDEAENAKPADARGRTDLRKFPLLTIDPPDARDHDDAVWAGPDDDPQNRGGYVAIVAIADVAYYVRPGSQLNREALKRGNSAYFPDRVVPMLPERLSADLCSLVEGEDRPCLAVRMVFDKAGYKKRHEFVRGIMRSAASLTYAEAQRAFEGKPDRKDVAKPLADLWACYAVMKQARDRREPLDLNLPERRIVIGEDGKVKSIAYRDTLDSMRVIEEFMVQANVAAAESLEKARLPPIYRVHEKPSKEKLNGFADYLRTIDVAFARGQVIKPGVFNRILANVKDGPHADVMNDVVLRTQSQAVYAPDNIGHFGLNLRSYAHFTSPIRRYADLVVHRALIRAFKLGDNGLTDTELGMMRNISDHISMTERRAMAAERDSTDRYIAAYMEDRVGASFDARITAVTRFGLFVRLPDIGADGLIPIKRLGTEYFIHDGNKHALIGQRSGTVYRLGDILRVKLMEAAPLTGGLRFDLAEAKTPLRGKPQPFVQRKKRKR